MESGKYYVLANGNNLFEGMTKEQIIAAITEATGSTPTSVDDAFITKIKELNRNTPLSFWIGTNAEYNSLQEIIPNCFYIFSDSDELADIETLAENAAEAKIQEELDKRGVVLYDGVINYGQTSVNIPDIDKYKLVEVVVQETIGNSTVIIPAICTVTKTENSLWVTGTGTFFASSFNPSVLANVYLSCNIVDGLVNAISQTSEYIEFRLAGGGIELYDCDHLKITKITGIM